MRPPQVVWLELTSKCPFDCTFCSRRNRRGAGNHMPIAMVEQVCSALKGASVIRLNYSGESVNHPEFDRALELATQTGAQTELVTALASTPASHLRAFVDNGLDRVSISLHTLDNEQFQQIYRFSSLDQLRAKIAELTAYKRERGAGKPVLDFSVVAMRENLGQLPALAAYARELQIRTIIVHPVIRRDPADADVSWELTGPQQLSEAFARELGGAVETAGVAIPEVAISVSRPLKALPLAEQNAPFTCEQNPFETTHILADGTVVPCEVLDSKSLGDLNRNTFGQIWSGDAYRGFRSDYLANRIEACAACEFRKPTAMVGPLLPVYGWHDRDPSGTLWSRRVSEAELQTAGSGLLKIDGILPPALEGANYLEIQNRSGLVGRVYNGTGGNQAFSIECPARFGAGETRLSFTVKEPYRNRSDTRELGFALTGAEWTAAPVAGPAASVSVQRKVAVAAFLKLLSISDRRPLPPAPQTRWNGEPGVAVLIPARGSVEVLRPCLESLPLSEVDQTVVLVNGSEREEYRGVERDFAAVAFHFVKEPLGFSRAIERGLSFVHQPWVYLMNSDMVAETGAISALLAYRAPQIFGLGSRIRLADGRSFETGFTRLRLAFGRAELEDREPSGETQNLYCGGGSSLFQTELLRELVTGTRCYDPFYWEDVEWGVTARGWGFESLFIGESQVIHQRRSTVNRFYEAAETERIFERNRLLFELRCLPSAISPTSLGYALEQACELSAREIFRPRMVAAIVQKRRRMLGANFDQL